MNIAIPIGFLILAIILLWFFIDVKGKFPVKVALILLTVYYSLVTWHSLGSYAGWPAAATPPEEFTLNWVVVREPNKTTKDAGAIYLWLTGDSNEPNTIFNIFKYKSSGHEPRAYELPYSTEMHEKAQKAKGLLMRGKVVRGKKGGKPGLPGEGDGDGSGKGGDSKGPGKKGSLSNEQDYEFHELLPSVLPDKYPQEES